MRPPSMMPPALLVGVPSALLASLPCMGSCFCVVALLGGGMLAAALYRSAAVAAGHSFSPREGALVGLITGLVHLATLFVITLLLYLFGTAIAALIPLEQIVDAATDGFDIEHEELLVPFAELTLGSLLGLGVGGLAAVAQGVCLGMILVPFHVASGVVGGELFRYDPPSAPSILPSPSSEKV